MNELLRWFIWAQIAINILVWVALYFNYRSIQSLARSIENHSKALNAHSEAFRFIDQKWKER
jgi:hypothetical protein